MSPQSYTIATELFPEDALEFYSLHNLNQLDEKGKHAQLYTKFYNEARYNTIVQLF